MEKEELHKQWHADPNNWKWGVFYFNREDKRLLVPKRIALLGWTINFANPRSILFFLVFIGVLFLIAQLMS
jgi:uncharacterized membrane protein